jgi:hypothetical protein
LLADCSEIDQHYSLRDADFLVLLLTPIADATADHASYREDDAGRLSARELSTEKSPRPHHAAHMINTP